jgi:redox-sensitive bicupin YhaK (pirin superfamily)
MAPSRIAEVGGTQVRRALPQRSRRTVGAWCFADHFGPVTGSDETPMAIGPHPHMGLHTVTWLLEGALLHRDSLGSEQVIRPGQLNVMTAGRGVSHAEEPTDGSHHTIHGVQLWVAQPESTRHGPAAFEHHGDLPQLDLPSGRAVVLVGSVDGVTSPAVHHTPLVGIDLEIRSGSATVPLDPTFEHCLVVLSGAVALGGHPGTGARSGAGDQSVVPGSLAYLGLGRDELTLGAEGPARVLVLGGEPFESAIQMWWNFVGRTRDEMADAVADWNAASDRFGDTGSAMARIPAPATPWRPDGAV